MLPRKMLCLLAVVLCLGALPVSAQELPCFAQEDLPEDLTGLMLCDAPQEGLRLGSRSLHAGDVLTAEQAAQMTFAGEQEELTYLPIFAHGTGTQAVLTIGKKAAPPVAEDAALETYRNMPITGKLKVSGEDLTYTVTRPCKRGTVEIAPDGTFTYTPKKNKVGIDSFVYTAAGADGKVSREATVTITILKPREDTQYTDTQDLPCRFTAQWLKNTGIFTGETIGENLCFGPEKAVTRGEFVTMLVKALDIPVDETLRAQGYTDEIPAWLQPFLAAAQRAGLTAALPEKETFGAEVPISAGEAASLTAAALDDTLEVMAQLENGPDAVLTRAQASQLLYEAARKMEK